LALVEEVRLIAEELVGEHFQLASFGPVRRCYEIVTLDNAGIDGRAPRALAKLCRYDRSDRPIKTGRGVSRLYRVCLQDDRLLTRASQGLDLRALLLYVVTHELIHIVRFESFQVCYSAHETERKKEEDAVHRLTGEVLHRLHDGAITTVIQALSLEGVDVVEAER
jgi:hypothetical protein